SIARTQVAPIVSPTSKVAMGDDPRAISRWEAVKIIVPLIGIAFHVSQSRGILAALGSARGAGGARQSACNTSATRRGGEAHAGGLEEARGRGAGATERIE